MGRSRRKPNLDPSVETQRASNSSTLATIGAFCALSCAAAAYFLSTAALTPGPAWLLVQRQGQQEWTNMTLRGQYQVNDIPSLVSLAANSLRPSMIPHNSKSEITGSGGSLVQQDGTRISSWQSVSAFADGDRLVLLSPQELFMFAPRDEPYTVQLPLESRSVQLRTLSSQPRLFVVDDFLLDGEAEQIMALARPKLQRAGVAFYEDAVGSASMRQQAESVRTSSNTFLNNDDPADHSLLMHRLETRISTVLKLTGSLAQTSKHMEELQVVHYSKGQHYDAHRDYFPKELYPSDRNLQSGANRLATLFFYLNDNTTSPPVRGGGETWFPRADGLPMIREYNSCKGGIKVAPKKNRAVLFYSLKAGGHMPVDGGDVDDYSWHGACHVLDGEKWGANKWLWNRPRR